MEITNREAGIPPEDLPRYWVDTIQEDLNCFADKESVFNIINTLYQEDKLNYFSMEDTGIFAYSIVNDFTGRKALVEVMFYLYPEYRGSIKLVKKYVEKAEEIALHESCDTIRIGANIRYKDASLLKLLMRWDYCADTVSKKLRG